MAGTPEDLAAPDTPNPPDIPGTPGTPDPTNPTNPSETSDPSTLSARQRRRALVICIAAAFLTLLDVSIVTFALPSMEDHLRMSPADVSLAIAGYTLTFGLTLVPAGRLGDEFGRRRILLLGLLLFTVTGVLCGAAPSAGWLDFARLARGVTAGLIAPQVVGLMQQMYPTRERGRIFGYYGATVALSTAIGPLLGGVILQIFGTADGWRYTFYLFIPFAALVFALALRELPHDRRTGARHSLDLAGALVLGLAVTAVMLPLLQTGQHVNRHWWLMGAGAVLLVVFVVRERGLARRGRQPLVDLNLFRVRAYWIGVLVAAALYGGFTGIFLVLAQYLQRGLHYTPLQSALATVAFTAGSVACGIVAGRQVQRFGRRLVIGGTAVTALGLSAAALVVRFSSGATMGLALAMPLLVAGCGAGCVISANQTLALQRVPRREGSTSAGVYQTGMKIGTSVGVTLATSLFFQEMTATRGDYAAAAALGLTGCAALAGVAFLVALAGFTLRVRGQSPAAVVGTEGAGSLAR